MTLSLRAPATPEAVLDRFAKQFAHRMLHGVWTELHGAEGEQREQLEQLLAKLLLRR